MKTKMKLWGALLGVLATGMLATGAQAAAGNPARVNIDVTITAALSVSVDGVASSTRTHNWSGTPNQVFDNAASSITVLNDTGLLTEKWALSTNGASINTAGGAGTWTLATSSTVIGADFFALQAVFGSSNTAASGAGSCGDATGTTWNNGASAPLLTASAVTYTNTVFGSSQLTNAGGSQNPDQASGNMFATHKRALCYRVIMPDSTSTTQTQNVQVTVTAQ